MNTLYKRMIDAVTAQDALWTAQEALYERVAHLAEVEELTDADKEAIDNAISNATASQQSGAMHISDVLQTIKKEQ